MEMNPHRKAQHWANLKKIKYCRFSAKFRLQTAEKRPKTLRNKWKRPTMAPDRHVWHSRLALAHLLSAGISCQAPRESAYEKMQKSLHVAKFLGIQNFHSKFFKKLFLTWESTCKCNTNLRKDFSDLQTCF